MTEKMQNKDKVIEYLSVIRDAEVSKPAHQADHDLIDACVGLLLDLQNKNAHLTLEQMKEAVNKIPFIDTEKIINLKTKKKKISKLKLLLIAAIASVLITFLAFFGTADLLTPTEEKFNEMFGSIFNTPINVIFSEGDTDFIRTNCECYDDIADFANKSDINILIPGEGYTHAEITGITLSYLDSGDEIDISFDDSELFYIVYIDKPLEEIIPGFESAPTTINGIECYIADLSEVGLYQVYFTHGGHTCCINHSDLEVITDLIENLEEIR